MALKKATRCLLSCLQKPWIHGRHRAQPCSTSPCSPINPLIFQLIPGGKWDEIQLMPCPTRPGSGGCTHPEALEGRSGPVLSTPALWSSGLFLPTLCTAQQIQLNHTLPTLPTSPTHGCTLFSRPDLKGLEPGPLSLVALFPPPPPETWLDNFSCVFFDFHCFDHCHAFSIISHLNDATAPSLAPPPRALNSSLNCTNTNMPSYCLTPTCGPQYPLTCPHAHPATCSSLERPSAHRPYTRSSHGPFPPAP